GSGSIDVSDQCAAGELMTMRVGRDDSEAGDTVEGSVFWYGLAMGLNTGGGGSGAEELSDLTDVGVTTPTSGNLLAADGDSWESVAMSGDATMASTGAITIAA